ncbi:cholesterol transport system auxiliary component [Maridesulfovibrio ferrireducens]|uniref:Cholesterol transport system auxiliary component n=1 Tax=Maridesulfovibrio ferrireducens TaxID=246191 RepID=A0A1G9F489_9BACT|nr:ABC-type transport auxiliary lipoprotein family protein [Maridesulfovibrio ferrireducens]SDK83224.1 cholesterol transport system auxiliary component [Maridesulfovibrio ferrireducens]
MKDYISKKALILCFAASLLIVAVAGCVKLERPSLDRKYYTLSAARSGQNVFTNGTTKNLIVRRIKVSSRYEDRDLVYHVSENVYEADYYNAFFVPPASMLTQELKVWMADSGIFANVLGPESMGTGEFLLEGVVNSIYGDISGPSPKAVINMQFFMLDNSSPEMPIIYSRSFNRDVVAKSATASALVVAMNEGITDIFSELEKDIAKVVNVKN